VPLRGYVVESICGCSVYCCNIGVKEGLVNAKCLKNIIDSALFELEAADLPDKVEVRSVEIGPNPF
jgi:hypothetical protein